MAPSRGILLHDYGTSLQLFRLGKLALTTEIAERWFDFAVALDAKHDAKLSADFANMVVELARLDLSMLWLHTSFAMGSGDARALIDEHKRDADTLRET